VSYWRYVKNMSVSTEITASDREARSVEMRAQGYSFQSIADTLGYSDASGASKAYHRALARRPAQNVDDLRDQESERLEYLWKKTAQVIERGSKVKTTSIGRTQYDVRTCTCPVKGRTDEDHYPDCPVEPVLDDGDLLRAIAEYRHLSESFRKLCGLDITGKPDDDIDAGYVAEQLAWARSLAGRVREVEAERDLLRFRLQQYEGPGVVDAEVIS
jgi:hypothetical protein